MQLAESSAAIDISGIDVHTTTTVPIGRLRVGGSPRLSGPDQGHVAVLSQVAEELPPIVVHRGTMTVIDGIHRLEVYRLRGAKVVPVRFFDGSDQDAFVEAVRLNSRHGKPLTLQERQQAAVRVLRIHPDWSDRAIAQLCGLSPKTVGARRQRRNGEFPQLPYRVGLDGKSRRVDPKPNGSSNGSAATVVECSGKGRRASVMTELPAPRWQPEPSPDGGKRVLVKDAAWQSTETGRAFASWFESRQVQGDDWAPLVNQLPLSRLIDISSAARACAEVWQQLADAVEDRLRRSGASS
jgi:hypothetical protein